jgi:hypothetical protein
MRPQESSSESCRVTPRSSVLSPVKLWDPETGKRLLTLRLLTLRGDWIAFTPDGYYDGSAGVERYLRRRMDGKLMPADASVRQFHRPDRVRQSLRGYVPG